MTATLLFTSACTFKSISKSSFRVVITPINRYVGIMLPCIPVKHHWAESLPGREGSELLWFQGLDYSVLSLQKLAAVLSPAPSWQGMQQLTIVWADDCFSRPSHRAKAPLAGERTGVPGLSALNCTIFSLSKLLPPLCGGKNLLFWMFVNIYEKHMANTPQSVEHWKLDLLLLEQQWKSWEYFCIC